MTGDTHVIRRAFFNALLIAGALGAAGCGTSAKPAPASSQPLSVSTANVAVVEWPSTFEAGGAVRARSTAAIASRVMAPVVDVRVRAGDHVRAGAVLISLDGRELAARRAQAEAALASAEENTRMAESNVNASEAAVALARAVHERMRTLHDKRSATTQELDEAVAALDQATARVSGARAQLSAAVSARAAAQAAGEAATIAASYSALTAPFDGVVAERAVDPGSMAAPGVTLLTVEDVTMFRLEVPIDEARALQVKSGDAAEVQIAEGASQQAWTPATVSEVARLDTASHSFIVKLDLPRDRPWRSGAFGRARFTGSSRRALAVPSDALVQRGQLTFVFTVGADNRARLQPVSTGAAAADRVEVLAGVHEGDRVIAHPPATISDGAPVEARLP